jgi:hypothetical protein
MQVVVQVMCKKGPSLRDAINKSSKLADYGLHVTQQKRNDRSNGWSKLSSTTPGVAGAVNVSWDSAAQMLLGRVITRTGKPDVIIGCYVAYLLANHFSRIQSVSVIPCR